MPKETARSIKTKELKKKVVEVTAELIREYGIENVSVQDICKRAGISNGSFFHHFKNKDMLIRYYVTSAMGEAEEKLCSVHTEDVREAIIEAYCLFDDFLMNQGVSFVKSYYTANNASLKDKEEQSPTYNKVKELFESGKREGLFEADADFSRFNSDIILLQRGIFLDWALMDGSYDMKVKTRELAGIYLDHMINKK